MSVTIQGVKRVLVEVYGERVSPCALKEYAEEIYGDIFVEEYALDSIFGTVYRLETEELGEDFQSEAMYVFDGVIDLKVTKIKRTRLKARLFAPLSLIVVTIRRYCCLLCA